MSMLLLQTAASLDAIPSVLIFFGCILFTLLLLFYIFLPVRVEHGEDKTRLAYLYERKDVIYENLRDLNFEYKAGKLGESDFQNLRNSMEEEAAAVLAEIDQLEKAAASAAPSLLSAKSIFHARWHLLAYFLIEASPAIKASFRDRLSATHGKSRRQPCSCLR